MFAVNYLCQLKAQLESVPMTICDFLSLLGLLTTQNLDADPIRGTSNR